ncbi:MAG: hypothetical protein L0H59_13790 [Tomitella sp.]|nr:hypothetical protein [Tomitella sp.]
MPQRLEIIAVDGPSGAGKTVFADALVARLRAEGRAVALVRTDHFATWDRPASWWPRLESEVLEPLAAGRPARYRSITWKEGDPVPGAVVDVPAAGRSFPRVLVLEGVTAARRSIAGRLSRSYWVEWGDEKSRLESAVARDGEACRGHLRHWQRFERGWFAVDGTRSRCEVVTAQRGARGAADPPPADPAAEARSGRPPEHLR